MDRWSKVLGDAGMESRTQMKGLDLKMSRSYSSEKRERMTGKTECFFLIIDIKNVKQQYPLVYIWFPFLRIPL